jgi:hypothetical protein
MRKTRKGTWMGQEFDSLTKMEKEWDTDLSQIGLELVWESKMVDG